MVDEDHRFTDWGTGGVVFQVHSLLSCHHLAPPSRPLEVGIVRAAGGGVTGKCSASATVLAKEVGGRGFLSVCPTLRGGGGGWHKASVSAGGGVCQNFLGDGMSNRPPPPSPRRVGHCGGLWVSAEGAGQGILPVVRHLAYGSWVSGWVGGWGGCPMPPRGGWGICGSVGLPKICGGWVPQITPRPGGCGGGAHGGGMMRTRDRAATLHTEGGGLTARD